MRKIRIYHQESLTLGQSLELSQEQSLHIGTVLRMKTGECLTLFCGDNREFSATILEVHKKRVRVIIELVQTVDRESSCQIHLAQGISKGDRMDFVIQKATELGVTSITPLITAHCAVKLDEDRLFKKRMHWQSIAISACEQCGRNQVPVIHDAMRLDVFLQQCQTSAKWILHPEAQHSWQVQKEMHSDMSVIVGPEGGLSDTEIQAALSQQFRSIRLGPRVLRTETAALAVLSVLQAVYGDL